MAVRRLTHKDCLRRVRLIVVILWLSVNQNIRLNYTHSSTFNAQDYCTWNTILYYDRAILFHNKLETLERSTACSRRWWFWLSFDCWCFQLVLFFPKSFRSDFRSSLDSISFWSSPPGALYAVLLAPPYLTIRFSMAVAGCRVSHHYVTHSVATIIYLFCGEWFLFLD